MRKATGKQKLLTAVGAVALGAAAREVSRRRRRLDLVGKTAVVTGGSRGLGYYLAREFANRGARIVVCARDEQELDDARGRLEKHGAAVLAVPCDVTDQDQVKRLFAQVREQFGHVDVLVNNAGIVQVGPMDDMTVQDYEEAMRTHFWGPLYAVMEVLPDMRRRRSGRIVNISSIGGKISVPHLLPYSASKFALVGLSEGLRSELLMDNVYVTTVCPGLIGASGSRREDHERHVEDDHAWFTITDSLPGSAISAESAAREIVEATINGVAELVLPAPARLAAFTARVAPAGLSEILGLVIRVLPRSVGKKAARQSGASPPRDKPKTRDA